MKRTADNFRQVGRVIKPHGIRGAMVVEHGSDFPQWLSRRACFYVNRGDSAMTPWQVTSAKIQSGGRLIITVAEVADRNGAEAERNTGLWLPEEEARQMLGDQEDYFFNSDLIGLRLIDADSGEDLGQVRDVIEMPAQNLLEILASDGNNFHVPFVSALIIEVDMDQGLLRARLPSGLTEVNR